MSEGEKRASPRVRFDHERPAQMMAIDGTWRRDCVVENIGEGGARLSVGDTIPGLLLTEFFLVLSPVGLAYRHCKLAWVHGDTIGVSFLNRGRRRKAHTR
jgi:PilZ domain